MGVEGAEREEAEAVEDAGEMGMSSVELVRREAFWGGELGNEGLRTTVEEAREDEPADAAGRREEDAEELTERRGESVDDDEGAEVEVDDEPCEEIGREA